MRLRKLKFRNFRCYTQQVEVDFESLTSIIGRNDAGKSTILEALAIFFEQQKPDSDDASKSGEKSDMTIACEFDELPERIVIDSTNSTTLGSEYILNSSGRLEIVKVYNGGLKTPTAKVFINANHPSAAGISDLLSLKNPELKNRAADLGVSLNGVNKKVNAHIRKAIRDSAVDLELSVQNIEVDTSPGAKELYLRIKECLPAYFLFRADRSSSDQDSEAQDPMKVAVRLAIEEQRQKLDTIALAVHKQVSELVCQTILKVEALSPEVASGLNPSISEPKWDSIFKISLTGDSAIPLNKRGSGVRRLVLLGFLQAQAEATRALTPDNGIIYAIEEPETSQHPDTQRALLQAVEEIAEQDSCQVILTTHTPMLGRLLPNDSLRYVSIQSDGRREIHSGSEQTTSEVARALGVLPDHDVRIFVGVEGKHDINFLRRASRILAQDNDQIKPLEDLEAEGRLIFIPVGGSNVGLWVARLHNLNIAEYHIFDRDDAPPAKPHYAEEVTRINGQTDCTARHTTKREIENYLHPQAIAATRPEVSISSIGDFDDVPRIVAQQVHAASESPNTWDDLTEEKKRSKISGAKIWLNTDAVSSMTPEMFSTSDPDGEIKLWLSDITRLALANSEHSARNLLVSSSS